MTLIKSISGIRGTIGGWCWRGIESARHCEVHFSLCYLIRKTCTVKSNKIVVGRDAASLARWSRT